MPHRILQIIPTLDRSGAEKQLSLLAMRLPRDEFDVRVVALTRGGPWQAELVQAGIPVEVLGKPCKLDPRSLLRLYHAIRDWQPDIVHTWIFAANCYGRVAARWAGVPHVVAAERCVDLWKNRVELAIDRYLARSTDAIVVNSEGTREFYVAQGLPRDKFVTIPNGIELPISSDERPLASSLRLDLHLPEDAKLVVTVGRLWPQKRMKDLIWAVDLLKGVRTDTHLLIVGDGPQRYALERYCNGVRLNDRVHFLGQRDDVPEILGQASCFWLASGYEGQSNALMEAMSRGLPVVATDIPGNRELISHEESGLLVPVGDSAGFARHTQMLLTQPDTARRLGQRAEQVMREEFGVERMIERYATFYRRLVNQVSPARCVRA